jgi:hypothetical protein
MVPLFKCQVLAAAWALDILSTHHVGQFKQKYVHFFSFFLEVLGWDVNVKL